MFTISGGQIRNPKFCTLDRVQNHLPDNYISQKYMMKIYDMWLRLVLDLYTRQRVTATWNFKKSYSFNVTNGVRQGGSAISSLI